MTSDITEKIQKYFETFGSSISMQQAAKELNISYKTFRKIAKELGLWQPQKPLTWPSSRIQKLAEFAEQVNFQTDALYARIEKDPELSRFIKTKRQLLYRAKKHGIKLVSKFPQVYQSTNFKEIFKSQTKFPHTRVLQRAFIALFASNPSEKDLLALDPNLSKQHLLRYRFFKNRACWTCGIYSHYEASFRGDIDHIYGDDTDHQLSHLRLLCPNCHRYTLNHSRNKSKKLNEITFQEKENLLHANDLTLYANFDQQLNIAAMKANCEATLILLKKKK